MNTGTYYLYEYEHSKRRRNVGFIRVSRHYRSCVLQINARGIPAGNGAELELYAFYCDGVDVYGTLIASLPCYGRNITARLPVTETRFPQGRPLMQIDGFLLRLPGTDLTFFWMASALFFEIHTDRFHLGTIPEAAESQPSPPDTVKTVETDKPTAESADAGETAETDEPTAESADAGETAETDELPAESVDSGEEAETDELPAESAESGEEAETDELPAESADSSATEGIDGTDKTAECMSGISAAEQKEPPEAEEPAPKDREENDAPDMEANSGREERETCTVRKISRRSLSELPRRFWHLANNSFLLHGYQNYGHLILIEEDGRSWLGVPGTYDLREARAADLFGFPKFSRSFTSQLELTADERNDRADFGYWCRCVGPCPGSK